jgi:hypothetical protein
MPVACKLNLAGKSPSEVAAWVKATGLGRRSHMGTWYSREEGGIVVPLRIAEALDELYVSAARRLSCRRPVAVFGDALRLRRAR